MSEAALWLNYCFAAAAAFGYAYLRRSRVVPAMLVGALASTAVWLAVSLGRGGSIDDPWLEPALFINASFALVFAAVGAAIAYLVLHELDGRP